MKQSPRFDCHLMMEKFKIINAEKDGIELNYSELTVEQSNSIVTEICNYLDNDIDEIVQLFYKGIIPHCWEKLDLTSHEDLTGVVNKSTLGERCYLLWWSTSEVNVVDTCNLCQYFDYYWYESSDDIFIISTDINKALFVRHDGAVFLLARNLLCGK